ncbi:protein Largen-like [Sinocyclocheilus rhinocerous]|uniref:protein Largen-like n=1 Tax=Sinocyclocheilus rhinocerous TaxID=307959 RepID=UPI0007BA418E|nr:PREDICTED: protein Largen-like [Sinocyclocheilus rhinocerous]
MSVSAAAAAAEDGGVNKVQVKRQIRCIVKDLENILGDLKDVAKELKEVVEEIDCLTSDLRLEEDLTDSSKTDTLNSSSSSTTTASSVKIYPEETLFRPPVHFAHQLIFISSRSPFLTERGVLHSGARAFDHITL